MKILTSLFPIFLKQTAARGARADECPGARVALQKDPRKACVTEKETRHSQVPLEEE